MNPIEALVEQATRPRLVVMTTVPITADKLLRGQLEHMSSFLDVHLITSPGPEVAAIVAREGVPVHTVVMHRRPRPISDLLALARLVLVLRRLRPHIVHAFTPKASLLGMLAARVVGTPIRVRTITGLPLMSHQGWRRRALVLAERLACVAATDVIAESRGIRDYMRDHVWAGRIGIIGEGSINGVDLGYFGETNRPPRDPSREMMGIQPSTFVFLFIGRVVRDKGVVELVQAFTALEDEGLDAALVIVGRRENSEALPPSVDEMIEEHPRIIETGWVEDVRPYLSSADAILLPSYREGLPNALLQAACFELPIIGTAIPGITDIVTDGRDGLLVEARDVASLAEAMNTVVADAELRHRLGSAALAGVVARYSQEEVWRAIEDWYAEATRTRGVRNNRETP